MLQNVLNGLIYNERTFEDSLIWSQASDSLS